jgi:hypothetical protein
MTTLTSLRGLSLPFVKFHHVSGIARLLVHHRTTWTHAYFFVHPLAMVRHRLWRGGYEILQFPEPISEIQSTERNSLPLLRFLQEERSHHASEKQQKCGMKYHFITMYFTTSILHPPERNVELTGGYVSRETCTELTATLDHPGTLTHPEV